MNNKALLIMILSIMYFLTISCETKIPDTDINCSILTKKESVVYLNEDRFTGSCFTLYDFNLEKDEIRSYKRNSRYFYQK